MKVSERLKVAGGVPAELSENGEAEEKEAAVDKAEDSFPAIIMAEALLALVQTTVTVALLLWSYQRKISLFLLPFKSRLYQVLLSAILFSCTGLI